MSTVTVKPELPSGVRDLLPEEALLWDQIINTVRKVYESFGFVPLETPCMERWGVLTGNDPSFNKSIFKALVVRGAEDRNVDPAIIAGADTALRFDLTVPLARVVSANPDLPRPFKRYQIGKVFRGEQPQAGRYREFTQFDFDIIGTKSVLADVEVIQVMYETLRALGVNRFTVRFSTRRVLDGLASLVGCADKARQLFRVVDKVDKMGIDRVTEELCRQPEGDWDTDALALSKEQIRTVLRFLSLQEPDSEDTLTKLSEMFSGKEIVSAERGIEELRTIVTLLKALGISQDCCRVDLSVARGLDYYTGPVFEAHLTDSPELGSVLAGGRFDGLTNRFMPGSNVPGVGASVGVDRLIAGLKKSGTVLGVRTKTKVLVAVFNAELREKSLNIARVLRQLGVNTEVYLGEDPTLRAQVSYAAKQGVEYVVIIGPEEVSAGRVQLKHMERRTQETLSEETCIARLTAACARES